MIRSYVPAVFHRRYSVGGLEATDAYCGGISWFMLFYDKCNGPLVGTYNIWYEVSLNFLEAF